MKTLICLAILALAAGCAGGPRPAPSVEPVVQHLVGEDEHVRIDELRVRGQTQRLTVQPKTGGSAYEILPSTSGQDVAQHRDAAGARVWPVLSF